MQKRTTSNLKIVFRKRMSSFLRKKLLRFLAVWLAFVLTVALFPYRLKF